MKAVLEKILPYSNKVGILEEQIRKYKQEYSILWRETGTDFPRFEKLYSKREQKRIEDEISLFVDWASLRLDDYPPEKDRQKTWLDDFVLEVKKFGKKILELSDVSLDSVFKEGFMDSTRMFVEKIKELGIDSLVLFGIEAHVCILKTALDALKNGLQVHVVSDAVSSRTAENKNVGIERMRQSGVFIASTETILFQLLKKAGTEEFKSISKLLKRS